MERIKSLSGIPSLNMCCCKVIIVSAFFFCSISASAQSIRIDNLRDQFGKGRMFKFSGGLSANSVFYHGNGGYGRNPFSYFINGNVNFNIYGLVNLPFSFTLSDMGGNYTYPIPPNRLSLHPSYKWVTAHIGNISMNFSSYTLSGYLFSGAGIDLEPEGAVKGSIIYGRLQKAAEYDTANRTVPAAYERWGVGARIQLDKGKYKGGIIVFHAWDDPQSLFDLPDSLGVFPMENTVISFNTGIQVMKQMNITVEYAASALTRDVRAESSEGTGILRYVVNSRASTGFYSAMKSQLQYSLENSMLGVAYERIDPGYQTLGAYYSNNDLENITVNAVQPLFMGKGTVTMNAGFQRDNLDNQKSGSSSRAIGSFNFSYVPTEQISAVFSYSNFQTYMRVRSQFQTINQLDNFQNLDTLDYTQVSQNANVSLNFILKQTEEQMRTLGVDVSFQETADRQGGIIRNGNGSQFYNASVMYSSQVRKSLNITGSFNVTYNTIGRNDFVTLGPSVGFRGKVLREKVSVSASASYNASKEEAEWDGHVLNLRGNTLYHIGKHHHFNLTILNQMRKSASNSFDDITITLGYNVNF